jgi:hypothetical protein
MNMQKEDVVKSGRAELDTHADTCGVNNVARILEFMGQVAEVSGFANSMQALQDIPIVKAALAYDDPNTGETIVLIINQALYFGKHMDDILLNPNQIRHYGHVVNDVPRHLGGSTHSIISDDNATEIPLLLRGVISYFLVRTPTMNEIENCATLTLTSENEWNPYSETFQEVEQNIYTNKIRQMQEVKVKSKGLFVSHEELSTRWAVSQTVAKETVKKTTQTFIRIAQLPIERRYRTKNVILKYNRLKCRLYSDTFFSNVTSTQGNKCGQLFATDFGYNKFVPMASK